MLWMSELVDAISVWNLSQLPGRARGRYLQMRLLVALRSSVPINTL